MESMGGIMRYSIVKVDCLQAQETEARAMPLYAESMHKLVVERKVQINNMKGVGLWQI